MRAERVAPGRDLSRAAVQFARLAHRGPEWSQASRSARRHPISGTACCSGPIRRAGTFALTEPAREL